MEPRHGIDINEHLDHIEVVVGTMPGAKWLLSNDIYPQVLSEGWMGLHDALKNFDPSKGNPQKTLEQKFRTFSDKYIKGRVLKWIEEAGWYDSLESFDEVAARPLTPSNYKGVMARPPTPGDFMGVADNPHEARELIEKFWELFDKLSVGHRELIRQSLRGERVKEIAAEQGKSEAAISMSRNLAKQKLRAGMDRARQTPMKPKTVAEADGQIRVLFPDAANLALQRQFEETMSIAGFELEIQIGEGGHAEVWRAKKHVQKPAKEQLVAIKRLFPQGETSPDAQRRFAREVRTASKLKHPNIVQFDDCVYDNGSLALVMEYVEGRDLAQLIAEGPLSRNAAVYLVEQVLAGLSHAHDRGIVHRDIKPSNILVSRDGAVKISDFGIAQAAVTHPTLARSHATEGTPAWMSPEHATGLPVDERSDLYVVGRVLRAVLRGQPDAELEAYVEKLMRPAPEDRFQSAGEALEALPKCDHRQATRELAARVRGEAGAAGEARPSATLLAPPSTAAVTSRHSVPVVYPPKRRWGTIAVAIVAAALLLLAGAVMGRLWTGDGEAPSVVAEAVPVPPPAVEPVSVPVPTMEAAPEVSSAAMLGEPGGALVQQDPETKPAPARQGQPRATKKRRPFLTGPLPENPYLDYLPNPEPQPTKKRRPFLTGPLPENPYLRRRPFLAGPLPENPYSTD